MFESDEFLNTSCKKIITSNKVNKRYLNSSYWIVELFSREIQFFAVKKIKTSITDSCLPEISVS